MLRIWAARKTREVVGVYDWREGGSEKDSGWLGGENKEEEDCGVGDGMEWIVCLKPRVRLFI